MPNTSVDHFKMRMWVQSVPEEVSKPRLARMARFCFLVSETPCCSEGQLRERWAHAAAPLQ